jgi:hypothetical protein
MQCTGNGSQQIHVRKKLGADAFTLACFGELPNFVNEDEHRYLGLLQNFHSMT